MQKQLQCTPIPFPGEMRNHKYVIIILENKGCLMVVGKQKQIYHASWDPSLPRINLGLYSILNTVTVTVYGQNPTPPLKIWLWYQDC